MKTRPILFNAEMVRAILSGKKTQTRRVIKPQPQPRENQSERLDFLNRSGEPVAVMWEPWKLGHPQAGYLHLQDRCPYGQPQARLWVRETWAALPIFDLRKPLDIDRHRPLLYKADDSIKGEFSLGKNWFPADFGKWRSSRFMPRWASRIMLEVLKVRVERVQDISENDAMAEGVVSWHSPHPKIEQHNRPSGSYRNGFHELWDSINSKRGFGWSENPWVWVVEFRLLESVDRGE